MSCLTLKQREKKLLERTARERAAGESEGRTIEGRQQVWKLQRCWEGGGGLRWSEHRA